MIQKKKLYPKCEENNFFSYLQTETEHNNMEGKKRLSIGKSDKGVKQSERKRFGAQ
jgi:hypothetical protein